MAKKVTSDKKTKGKKEHEEPEYVEAIEFEKFCDYTTYTYNKRIISILFGQEVYTPTKVVCRIWMDPMSMKELHADLSDLVKTYEKRYGKIE